MIEYEEGSNVPQSVIEGIDRGICGKNTVFDFVVDQDKGVMLDKIREVVEFPDNSAAS